MSSYSFKLSLLVAACVALFAASHVDAECSGPEAYGDFYAVEQKAEGLTPKLENDELVLTVSAEGLAPGDGCPVPAAQQFELTWFKHKDLAMIKLKRTAPKECVTGLRGGTGQGASVGMELRLPLPEELKHGTAHGDFSRMLIGMPPGGLYESYLLFDNSMLTGTAQKWNEVEAAQEGAAAVEKLELLPGSAAAEDSGRNAGDGAAGAAGDAGVAGAAGVAGENAKTGEEEAVNAAADGEGEAAKDKTGDDTSATAGVKSVPRKAGAATA